MSITQLGLEDGEGVTSEDLGCITIYLILHLVLLNANDRPL